MTPNRSGRHFLQIPGPTNVPDRVLRAMAQPTIDHRGDEFAAITREVLAGLQSVFKNSGPVIVYPSSATGAWEAAFVNTMSPGDKVLSFEIGEFARLWAELARRLGLEVEVVDTDWTRGVDPGRRRGQAGRGSRASHQSDSGRPQRDIDRRHQPSCRNSPGDRSREASGAVLRRRGVVARLDRSPSGRMGHRRRRRRIAERPDAAAGHELQLDQRRRRWWPRGRATLMKSYWSWDPMIVANAQGYFTYTPSTNLIFGLREALRMLREEGLDNVFARHERLAEAARAAVRAWGLEILCKCEPERSPVVTTVMMPDGFDADEFRRVVVDRLNLSLGTGLGRLKGRAFRIGHLGDFNELMLMGTLCGVEMGFSLAGVPFNKGGAAAAMESLVAPRVAVGQV